VLEKREERGKRRVNRLDMVGKEKKEENQAKDCCARMCRR
jgi:hypothetical protein